MPNPKLVSCIFNLGSGLSAMSTQEISVTMDPHLQYGADSQHESCHDEPDTTTSITDSVSTITCDDWFNRGSEEAERPTNSRRSNKRGAEGAFEAVIEQCHKRRHSGPNPAGTIRTKPLSAQRRPASM